MKRKGTKERKTAGDAYLIYDRELWVAFQKLNTTVYCLKKELIENESSASSTLNVLFLRILSWMAWIVCTTVEFLSM